MEALTKTALPIRNNRLRLSQGTLFWREVGYGPTLLFLHGNWQNSRQWVPLMSALSPDAHCVAPDLLGFGESSPLPQPGTVDAEVANLVEFLAKLRVQPRVIVADSLGAWVATRFCLQCPHTVQMLVLMVPEGLAHPVLERRWRQLRWLANRWDLRYWLVQLLSPVLRLGGGDRWLKQIQQRRRLLKDNPTTGQLLFQRRKSALQAEWLNEVLPQLKTPVILLQPEEISDVGGLAHTLFSQRVPQVEIIAVAGDEYSVWDGSNKTTQAQVQTAILQAIAPSLKETFKPAKF